MYIDNNPVVSYRGDTAVVVFTLKTMEYLDWIFWQQTRENLQPDLFMDTLSFLSIIEQNSHIHTSDSDLFVSTKI